MFSKLSKYEGLLCSKFATLAQILDPRFGNDVLKHPRSWAVTSWRRRSVKMLASDRDKKTQNLRMETHLRETYWMRIRYRTRSKMKYLHFTVSLQSGTSVRIHSSGALETKRDTRAFHRLRKPSPQYRRRQYRARDRSRSHVMFSAPTTRV